MLEKRHGDFKYLDDNKRWTKKEWYRKLNEREISRGWLEVSFFCNK